MPVRERLHLEYLDRYYPDHLALDSPSAGTLDALHKHMMGFSGPIYVVHIDAHGEYRGQGHIAFETSDGDVHWISGEDLGHRLHSRGVPVVVLSACRSGLVGGKSTFNSVSGALVKQCIPAVVSMQFSIEVKQAEKFAEFFYWALMNGMPLTEAVAEARIALSRDSWYRPVLYLRTDLSNFKGGIFAPKSRSGLPKKLTPRQKWIARLGFDSGKDPFRYTDGGTDPILQEYFYFGMRHFYEILGDVSRPETVFVFGSPGTGKSSLRNVISQLCPQHEILSVVYQDFAPLVRKHQRGEEVQIDDHIACILKSAIRTLSDLAKGLDEEAVSAPKTEESRIVRNQLWFYVASNFGDDPLREHVLKKLLRPEPEAEGALPRDPHELLERFCQYVTRLFKSFQFVYILVDPDNDISPDKEIAWHVLKPLISTRRLLELSGDTVAFKFFLSQRFCEQAMRIPWIEQEQSKRIYQLQWPDKELDALLSKRLELSSEGRYRGLGELSEGVEDLDSRVARLAMGRPRELIAICNRLFSEHCRRWSADDGEPLLITAEEVDGVLRPFHERYRESALERLVAQGESERLEFKSTMRYNLKANRSDKEMEREIARTLCAFMNTEGGTLIVGVDDNGSALGLDEDFSTLGRRKDKEGFKDGFEQAFVNITENMFASPLSPDDYESVFVN